LNWIEAQADESAWEVASRIQQMLPRPRA